MSKSHWRGEHIVLQRDDGTADVYFWDATCDCYRWLGDYASSEEADRYVRDMEALPELPEIKPLTDAEGEVRELTLEDFRAMRPIAEIPSLQSIFDLVWTKQQARKSNMSYDHWKTTEPDEPEEWAACDACGVHKPWRQMFLRTTGGRFPIEVWACDECCGVEPEDDDGPPLTQAELQERTREMLAPCTDLARRQGCTCSMDPYAYEEVRINRNCPLHGSQPDEDARGEK